MADADRCHVTLRCNVDPKHPWQTTAIGLIPRRVRHESTPGLFVPGPPRVWRHDTLYFVDERFGYGTVEEFARGSREGVRLMCGRFYRHYIKRPLDVVTVSSASFFSHHCSWLWRSW